MGTKRLAIVGASYLQRPLVIKAKEMGFHTVVFAWPEGNAVRDICDSYHPISILEKEKILAVCEDVMIDGIISIASDLAVHTVNYVACELGLNGNSREATMLSTDKYLMKAALRAAGLCDQNFALIRSVEELKDLKFDYPCIVKPTDRSGSRGVLKVESPQGLLEAVENALHISLKKRVIVEDCLSGAEYSVEFISFKGVHYPLAITEKVTSGFPYFVEKEQHQPSGLDLQIQRKIFAKVQAALNALGITNGASHSEIFLDGLDVHITEIAGRMGGDFIGSHLVPLSTGFDFVRAAIDVACNRFDYDSYWSFVDKRYAGIYYLLPDQGVIQDITDNTKYYADIVHSGILSKPGDFICRIDGSDKRAGFFIYHSQSARPIADPERVIQFNMIR